MPTTITPGKISWNNLWLIYDHIYNNGPVSQQDLSYALRLSRPTIAAKLNELEEHGLVQKNGVTVTEQVGRKAAAYSIVSNCHVAIGAEILKDQIKLLMVDLTGNYSHRKVDRLRFENSEPYVRRVCETIEAYIRTLPVSREQILGIGFSMQGLVSSDGTRITYGKILNCTGMQIQTFQKYLHLPCRFLHDADAAAGSELWVCPELNDFVYLLISIHMGVSIVHSRAHLSGIHGHAALVEHLSLHPNGKPCYCGKRGCIETTCSMSALLGDTSEELFFDKVRNGDPAYAQRWNRYLKDLARAIHVVYLAYDSICVLGGYLAAWLTEEDIEKIYEELETLSLFPEKHDFIRISRQPKHSITIGAALPYIRDFLNRHDVVRDS